MKIVCPDGDQVRRDMLEKKWVEQFQVNGGLTWYNDRPESTQEYLRRVEDAEGVLLFWGFPLEVMARCHNLKIVSYVGTGAARYIDLEAATEMGITVCNVPTYCDNAVAEHTFALMLGLARQINSLEGSLRQGDWPQPLVMELKGKVLGLLGLGSIGRKVAALANAFEMKVICWTKHPSPERAKEAGVEFVSFNQLFSEADIVSLHLTHSTETEGIVGKNELALMKPGSLLINTARGELVDTSALVAALKLGSISGAGLDVFASEPLPAGHSLTKLDNVILSPHVAFNTPEAIKKSIELALENFIQFEKGEPVNVVNEWPQNL